MSEKNEEVNQKFYKWKYDSITWRQLIGDEKMTVIRKTVALHQVMDQCVRKLWARLIEEGKDASYSTALNALILIAIMELGKPEGLSEETLKTLISFLNDQKTIESLNVQDFVANLETKLIKSLGT